MEQGNLSPADQKLLAAQLDSARAGGAELHTLKAGDFVQALLELAREQRVTQVFIGHSLRQRHRFVRTPVDRLINAADSFDVRVFPHKGGA